MWDGLSAGRRRLPLCSLRVVGILFLLRQGAMTEMTGRCWSPARPRKGEEGQQCPAEPLPRVWPTVPPAAGNGLQVRSRSAGFGSVLLLGFVSN